MKIGINAKSFNLSNQKGEMISLKDYKGKKNVVLYFYPRALTPGCTVQAKGISEHYSEFEELDTVVLGVSADPIAKLTRFDEKYHLNFNLLSDESHKMLESYEVWRDKLMFGKSILGIKRMTFIIGKDGLIKHIIEKVKTKTHHQDVITYIKENLI